jgi:hypothetical protein
VAGPTGNETNHILDGVTVRGGLAIEGAGGLTTYLNRDAAAFVAREAVRMRGQGYYAETLQKGSGNTQTVTTSGTTYCVGIGLLAGDVVTNISVLLNTVPVAPTLTKVGIFTKAGTLLGASADASAAFATLGLRTTALTSPVTITADDYYYLAFLNVAGTGAALVRGGGGLNINTYNGVSGSFSAGVQTSQSDLGSGAITLGAAPFYFWFGVS